MKATLRNRIKLWWHCLIHLHRSYKWTIHKPDEIGCADCDVSFNPFNTTIEGASK